MITKTTAKSLDAWNETDTVPNISVFVINLADSHNSLTKLILLFLYVSEEIKHVEENCSTLDTTTVAQTWETGSRVCSG